MWLRKGNFKKKAKSLLIAVQNNAIRTSQVKAWIDNIQQNSRCRLCDDRDETINHIISECSKLSQKEYKAWHDWVGRLMHWEQCKELKFDYTNKWYMHNQSSFLENVMHKLLWNFEIQTDHEILARRPDLIIIKKKKKEKKRIIIIKEERELVWFWTLLSWRTSE